MLQGGWEPSVHRADEYRQRAKEALALMSKCQLSSRALLPDFASAWLTLADAPARPKRIIWKLLNPKD